MSKMASHSLKAKQVAAFLVLLLGLILFVVGFSTPYWSSKQHNSADERYFGLWRNCSVVARSVTCTDWIDTTTTPDYLQVVQAFETIGLILLLTGFILLCVYLFWKPTKTILYLIICFLVFAVVFILIGVVVFGVEADQSVIDNLNFSFYFVVISMAVILISDGVICLF